MLLTGTYTRTLDEKQRLAIPKRLFEEFEEPELKSLYVSPGLDKSLALYSPTGFQNLATRLSEQLTNPVEARNYMRLLYARSERTDMDSQSRIRLPERLVEMAGLRKDVVLIGVQDHAEIWDAAAWEEFMGRQSSSFDAMAEAAFAPPPK